MSKKNDEINRGPIARDGVVVVWMSVYVFLCECILCVCVCVHMYAKVKFTWEFVCHRIYLGKQEIPVECFSHAPSKKPALEYFPPVFKPNRHLWNVKENKKLF